MIRAEASPSGCAAAGWDFAGSAKASGRRKIRDRSPLHPKPQSQTPFGCPGSPVLRQIAKDIRIAKDIGLTDSGGAPGALVRTGRFEAWTSGCAAAGRDFAGSAKASGRRKIRDPFTASPQTPKPDPVRLRPFGCVKARPRSAAFTASPQTPNPDPVRLPPVRLPPKPDPVRPPPFGCPKPQRWTRFD